MVSQIDLNSIFFLRCCIHQETELNLHLFMFLALRFLTVPCILDFAWSKNIINRVLDDFPSIFVKLPFDPHYLSVSGASGSILIVCGLQQQHLRILCFDISDLNAVNADMQPFATIALDGKVSDHSLIQSMDWHPEYSESLLLIVLSNGSLLSIGVNLANRSAQLLTTLVYHERITAVSWSPKGKQFVLGKENGQLVQLKHKMGKDFEEAKIIRPPAEYAGFGVKSLRWCFSNLFSVCYAKIEQDDLQTKFTTIYAPTKTQPTFNDHGSVCMDFFSQSSNYRADFLHFDNILITSTSCSSELCVIGCDDTQASTEKWKQWILDDSARVELPLAKDGKDTYPRGIALFLNDTKQFKISETETYGGPNCPLMLILNSAGVLCSYYIVYPKLKIAPQLQKKQLEFAAQPVSNAATQKQPPQVVAAPIPIVAAAAPVTPASIQQASKPQVVATQAASVAITTAATKPPQSVSSQAVAAKSAQPAIEATIAKSRDDEKRKQELDEQGTYALAIKEEIVQFTTLLNKMKVNCKQLRSVRIGKSEEGRQLVLKTEQLKQAVNEAVETGKVLNLEILEKMLFEDFVSAEEAKKRLDQKTDSKFKLLHSKGMTSDTLLTNKYSQIFDKKNWLEKELKKFDGESYFQNYFNILSDRKTEGRESETPMHLIFTTLANNHKSIRAFDQQLKHFESKLPLHLNSKSGDAKGQTSEISIINQLLKQCSIDEQQNFPNVATAANGAIVGNRVVVKQLSSDKRESLRKHLEQINQVPVIRSSLPTDVNSSLIISAVTKAEEKLKNLRKSTKSSAQSSISIKAASSQVVTATSAPTPVKSSGQAATNMGTLKTNHSLPIQPHSGQGISNPATNQFAPPSPFASSAMPFMSTGLGLAAQQQQLHQQVQQANFQELLLSQISLLQSQPAALLALLNNYKNMGIYDPMLALNNLAGLDAAKMMSTLDSTGLASTNMNVPPLYASLPQLSDKTPATIQKALQQTAQLPKPSPAATPNKGGVKKDSNNVSKPNYEDISPPTTPMKPAASKVEAKLPTQPVQSTPIKLDQKAPVNFSFNLLGQPSRSASETLVSKSDKATTNASPFSQLGSIGPAASTSTSAPASAQGTTAFSFPKLTVPTVTAVPTNVASNQPTIKNNTGQPNVISAATVTTASVAAPIASPFSFTPQKSTVDNLTLTSNSAVPFGTPTPATLSTTSAQITSAPVVTVVTAKPFEAASSTTAATATTATTSQSDLPFSMGCLGGAPNPANVDKNPFGNVKFPAVSSTSIFGSPATTTASIVPTTASNDKSIVSSATVAAPTTTATNVTTSTAQPFSQVSVFGTPPSSQPSAFGQKPVAAFGGTAAPFGFTTGSVFGSPATSTTSPFSKPIAGNLFGATTNAFGSPASTVTTTQSGSVFGGSAFGSATPAVSATPTPFSATPATTSTTGAFGTPSTFGSPFNKPSSGGSIFGSGFGATSTAISQPATTSSLTTAAPAFGAKPAFGAPPAFGSPPAFGASSAFGSPPKFGAAPAFGATPTFGSGSVFGSNPSGFSSPVSSAANTNTFGSATSSTGGFGG